MPYPLMNIINGGAHDNNSLEIQEFLIRPDGAKNFKECMQMSFLVIQNLKKYSANIIVHQGIPTINKNNLSEYSEKKHILYIQHDVTVSCIKNTYNKIHLFDKYIYKYIFVSNWQKNRYIRYYGLNNEKCVVIQNAINPIINLKLSSIKKTFSFLN